MDEDYTRYFWDRVKIDDVTGCWDWTSSSQDSKSGRYGLFHFRRKRKTYAHRIAYILFRGVIPDGMHVDHLCRNTLCVNPDHLEAVTPRENVLRGVGLPAQNARLKIARCGHPLSTYGAKQVRMCVKCHLEKMRQAYWEKKGLDAPPRRAAGTAKCGHAYSGYNRQGTRVCGTCQSPGVTIFATAEEFYRTCSVPKHRFKNGKLVPLGE